MQNNTYRWLVAWSISLILFFELMGDDVLTFGCTTDLSSTMSAFSYSIIAGTSIAFDFINAQGGVQGKKLKLITRDDEYKGEKARANVEQFLKDKIDIILSPFGTPTLMAYLDIITEGRILVLFPITGGTNYQSSDYKNLIKFRESGAEGFGLAQYAFEELNAKKIILFYQTDMRGTEVVEAYFSKAHFKDFLLLACDAHGSNIDALIAEVKKFQPDSFIFLSMPIPTGKFLEALGASYLEGKKLLGWSGLSTTNFKNLIQEKKLKFIFSSILPNPVTSTISIAADFMTECTKKNIEPDIFSFEGYVNALVLVELLKKVQGPVTREKIVSAAESMKDFDVGGLKLTFNEKFRSISSSIWLDTGSPDWKKISIDELAQMKFKKKETAVEHKMVPLTKMKKVAVESVTNKQSAEAKAFSDRIIFGCPTDLSRNMSMLSLPLIAGVELVFDDVNENGGIHGKRLVLQAVDDQYTPEITRTVVKRLLGEKIDMFLCPVGDPTILSYLDLIKEGKVLVLFPHVASTALRKTDLKYLVHFSSSLTDEGYVLARYALETMQAQKIVIIYQTDKPCIDGILAFFNKKNFKNYKEITYDRKTTNFDTQVKAVVEFQPDCIINFAIPQAAIEFVRQYGVENLAGKHLLAWSILYTEQFKRSMQSRGLRFVFCSPVPNPETSTLQVSKDFRDACLKNSLKPEIFTFEGYLNARILVEILKKIEDQVTKEKIIQTVEAFKNFDLGGIPLNFNPNTRSLFSSLWLITGDDDWKLVSVD